MKFLLFLFSLLFLSSCDNKTSIVVDENLLIAQTDTISISDKFYQEGLKYNKVNNIEKAKYFFKKAIDSSTSNDAQIQFKYYISLIGIHRFKNEYGDALAVLKKYEEKELLPVSRHKSLVINTEQYLYLASGRLEDALSANEKYYQLSLEKNIENQLIESLLLKNIILYKLGNLEQADEILNILKKRDDLDVSQRKYIAIQIGIQKFHQGNFKEAIYYYKNALAIEKASGLDGNINGIAAQYSNIAEAFIELKNYPESRVYLDSFVAIDQNKVSNSLRTAVLKYELRIANDLNFPNSKVENLIDKISKDQEILYQNRFNKELELLSEEKIKSENLFKENQNVELRRLKFKNNAILSVSLLIIIILIILIFVFKQKRDHEVKNLKNQQRLLRAQMNPHFIFNVLSSIQNLVRTDSKSAPKFITKFSRLLRTVLENSMQNYVSVTDEINVIKNYLDLQKLRFPNLFDYEIDMDSELEDHMITIPPMLIQPFVENAIEHGFKGINYKGMIKIVLEKKIESSKVNVSLKIIDNGVGYQTDYKSDKKSASVYLISNFIKKSTGENVNRNYANVIEKSGTIIEFKTPTN